MAGALCGAYAGEEALPRQWRELVAKVNKLDIPRWAERLAAAAQKLREAGPGESPIIISRQEN